MATITFEIEIYILRAVRVVAGITPTLSPPLTGHFLKGGRDLSVTHTRNESATVGRALPVRVSSANVYRQQDLSNVTPTPTPCYKSAFIQTHTHTRTCLHSQGFVLIKNLLNATTNSCNYMEC